jgi:hypothetical protein
LNVALSACAVVGAFGFFWTFRQLQVERTERAALEQRLADLQSQLETARATALAPPALTTAVTPAVAPTPSPAPIAVAAAQPRQDANELIRESENRQRRMLQDPAYREAVLAELRRRHAGTRRDAIRLVGMTPEQADRVIDLWVARNLRFMERGASYGQEPDENAKAEMRRAADAEQQELRTLLGDEKYEEWRRYLASGQERAEVESLRAGFEGTPHAIDDSQAAELALTIHSERERLSREYDEYANASGITDRNVVRPHDRQRWIELAKEANQRIHAAAATRLSTAQLAELDKMLAARLAPAEAALRMQLEGRKK